jgi:integrase
VRILTKDIIPQWCNRPAREIRRRDVIELIDSIKDRGAGIMANRTLSVIKRVYNFGISRDIVEVNPTSLVEAPGKEIRRDRVLSENEIRIFWECLGQMELAGDLVRSALRLILILGQRPGEIVSMEWKEFDYNSAVWEIPGEKTKNRLPHRVLLSSLAIQVLKEIEPLPPYVFPSRVGSGINPKQHINAGALAGALRRNRQLFDIERFTPHDLRRTAASRMASIGVNRHIIKRILNHAERDVTSIYDRYSYDREKREALEAWSIKLDSIITGNESKIIPIAR